MPYLLEILTFYVLSLPVTQKTLQLSMFLFSSLSYSSQHFERTDSCCCRMSVIGVVYASWTNWAIAVSKFTNFVCESMSCHVLYRKTVMADLSEHVESCPTRIKTLYLHYHNVYGHQTWQVVNLPVGSPTQ